MPTKRELALEARLAFWDDCHQQIEDIGYKLGKDGMMIGDEDIRFMTGISPGYDEKMGERFREIFGTTYRYKNNEYKIILSPRLSLL